MDKRFVTTARANDPNRNNSSQLDNESLSSVGSMESASVVANCFDDSHLPSSHQGSSSSRTTTSSSHSHKKSKSLHRECPHCKKKLSSYHAVQTHLRVRILHTSFLWPWPIITYDVYFPKNLLTRIFTLSFQIHDRAGEFHCAKCTFKSRSQDELKAHDKKHRTCSHCGKLFTHLHKHKLSCMKAKSPQWSPFWSLTIA